MEKITFAPAYVAFYPMLAEIARAHGYSLAVHGSVGKNAWSDLDLIAVPWIEDAVDAGTLMQKIADWTVTLLNVKLVEAMKGLDPVHKPHGRLAYRISIGNGACVDISVMPRRAK